MQQPAAIYRPRLAFTQWIRKQSLCKSSAYLYFLPFPTTHCWTSPLAKVLIESRGIMSTNWADFKALPTLGVGGSVSQSTSTKDQPSWNRSMASLQVASQSLLEQSSGTTGRGGGFTTTPGSSLMGGGHTWRYATEKKGSASHSQTTTHAAMLSPLDAVLQHQESILNEIEERSNNDIHKRTTSAIDKFLQDSWDRKHAQWTEELGGGRSARASNANLLTDSTLAITNGSSASNTASPMMSRGMGYTLTASQAAPSVPVDLKMIQEHGNIVKDMNRLELSDAARAFGSLTNPNGSSAHKGYVTGWKWLEILLNYRQRYGHADNNRSLGPVDQGIATMLHLSHQFKNKVETLVQHAMTMGQTDLLENSSYDHPVAQRCEAFGYLKGGQPHGSSLWPVLYYCLRCGNGADAALEVWQVSKSQAGISETVGDAVTRLLSAMIPWEESNDIPRLQDADRHIVNDFLQSLKEDTDTQANDAYQVASLALLSGSEGLPVDNSEGLETIEDYLFGELNKALFQRNPEEELVEVGRSIQSYGPSHFGANETETGGWSYAIPLLMTQQYSKALKHLVELGGNFGLLQATHLGLLLSKASIELKDLGQTDPAAYDDDLAAELLVHYSDRFLLSKPSDGSLEALEYLCQIPKRDRKRKEVASLIVKTGDHRALAGVPDRNGRRVGGDALDRKFSIEDISWILCEAGDILYRENDYQKFQTAAMCYLLSERYDRVLRLLNELMLPPNQQDPTRTFWITETENFHTQYLSKRTYVVEKLEKEGKGAMIETNRLMVELNYFFIQLNAHRFSDAESIAYNTNLVPVDRNDLAAKQDQLRAMDDSIKRSFPEFLVGVMNCLYNLHVQTKTGGARDDITMSRLSQLQERAKVLLTFGGTLGLAGEQINRLNRLEAHMC